MSKKIDHSSRGHSLLSPSGAHRWMNCTPSPILENEFPNKSSSFAEEGTLAHEFAELNLKLQLGLIKKVEYNKLVKPFRLDKHYSSEMEGEVQKHIDYVIQQLTEAKRKTKDAVILIEEQVDLSDYIEDSSGTCDDIIVADGVMDVIDLKYGKGVRVSAIDNPQLKLYGLGALSIMEMMYDIHTVRLTITQPRLDSISSWEISTEDLKKWGEENIKPVAIEASKGQGDLKAGDWCRFCRAKVRCSALFEDSIETAKMDFSTPSLLSDEEVIDAYKKFKQIQDWMNAVSAYLLSEALAGRNWPGHKLVMGRSNRIWSDTEEAETILKFKKFDKEDYMTVPKLYGIGAIEKLVGKTNFPEMFKTAISKPPGKPTFVPKDDLRLEYHVSDAKADFS